MTQCSPDIQQPAAKRRKVLVVDDDPILREVMSGQLASLDWDVSTAENGEAALRLMQRYDPELAIIDISMPELDGFGLLSRLRQNPRTADLPVIVCTSHNDREAVDRAYQLGASSFISKPINWPQFLHHAKFVMRSGDTERALRAAEADAQSASRSKGAMFQVLSHELKTPLTALIGLSSVIHAALQGHGDGTVSEHLEHVIDASQRLNAIVSDITLLAKAVSGDHQRMFDVAGIDDILDESLSGLKAKARNRKIRLIRPPLAHKAQILCDPRLLHQAVFKLLDNAIKFSPEGGAVELWSQIRDNGAVVISVRDQGPGLTQQKLSDCLKPFVQANMSYSRPADGLGLGLPIAKAICAAHGGELVIQTAVGQGLQADIVLPASLQRRKLELRHA